MPTAFANRALTLFVAGALLVASACGSETTTPPGSDPATETFASSLGVDIATMTKVSPDLYTKDVVAGSGAAVANGRAVTVTYTGWLANGTQFDSNVGKSPFTFTLGAGSVIRGWDLGLAGVHVGGTRQLVIGSALGYGASGFGPIPPNATLVFTVQVTAAQ